MGRRSSIERLPEKIRQKITALRDQNHTIDEILAALDTLNVDVSRSALGRHVKKMDQVAAQMRKSRTLAEAIGRQFGDKETSKVARTNIEILHSLLMKIMIGPDDSDEEVVLDPKEAMFAATTLEKLAKASKLDLDTQITAAVEEARQSALEKAADDAADEARERGLSPDTVQAIRSSILGIGA